MVALGGSGVGTLQGNGVDRTNGANYYIDQWEDEVFAELRETLYFMNLVSEVPTAKITGGIYHQPKVGLMGSRNMNFGNPVTLQAYTEDQFTMEFKRYREASFMIGDIHAIFDDFDLRAEYTREIAFAHAIECDYWIQGYRAVINAAGNVVNSVDTGGANAPLNRAAIIAAKLVADKNFMPKKGRVWVFAPDQLASLTTVPEFTSGDYVSGQPTMTGEIGMLYGIPVVINDNIKKNTATAISWVTGESSGARVFTDYPNAGYVDDPTGTPNYGIWWPDAADTNDSNGAGQETLAATDTLPENAYTGGLFCKDWLKFGWAQSPKLEADRQVTFQGNAVVSTCLYDAKVYRPEHAVIINSYETT